MTASALHRYRLLALSATLLSALVACSSPTPPPPVDGLNLEGLWLVEPGPGTEYGAGGTTTLEFGPALSGSATFLSQADANDITSCERHVYALLAEDVILLDEDYYLADEVNADTIELSNDTDSLTLTRVTGAAPVAACGQATLTERGTFADGVSGFSSLSATGSRLYFNVGTPGDPIGSFDTATNSFGALRTYTQSVSGGTHRMVVAARTDDLFYGHCACGGSGSVNAFNLATNTSILDIETEDLGMEISIRYGYFDSGSLTIGGRSRADSDVNLLLTLNPDTLALESSREFLFRAFVDDVAVLGGAVIALVEGDLVVVGNDGRAAETVSLAGLGTEPTGLATVGSTLYLLASVSDDETAIFAVALP